MQRASRFTLFKRALSREQNGAMQEMITEIQGASSNAGMNFRSKTMHCTGKIIDPVLIQGMYGRKGKQTAAARLRRRMLRRLNDSLVCLLLWLRDAVLLT